VSKQFREYLKKLNRKERFYVVKESTKNGFELDTSFKQKLEDKLKINIPENDAFISMDYHLDWIYASLFLCKCDNVDSIFKRNEDLITATQEDVDLIIAAPDTSNSAMTNLILIEAKGHTSWTNKQSESKAKRLSSIFKSNTFEDIVTPYYLIWSPKPPKNLNSSCFPEWAKEDDKLLHIQLPMPDDLVKITCCDQDGKDKSMGSFWKIGS